MTQPIRLGDLLVRANVISEVQLQQALAEQQRWGGRLGGILVRMGLLTEDLLVKALSKQLGGNFKMENNGGVAITLVFRAERNFGNIENEYYPI